MNNLQMPPVKNLVKESWDAFKACLGNVVLLSLFGSMMGIVVMIAIFVGFAGVGFWMALSGDLTNKVNLVNKMQGLMTPDRVILYGLILLVILLAFWMLSVAVRLAIIYAVGNYKEKPKMGTCLVKGFSLIIPTMVVGAALAVILVGGYFVLVIPGIIMSLLFGFVTYEMILGGKKWFAAVGGSVQVMSQHFGEIVLRLFGFGLAVGIVFELPMYLLDSIAKVLANSAPAESLALSGILLIIRIVLGAGLGIFGIVFSVITYKQAKEVTDEKIAPNMVWMWVVAIVGWLIAALIGMQLIKIAKNPAIQSGIKAATEEAAKAPTLNEQEKIANWRATMKPDAKILFDKSQGLFAEMKNAQAKPAEVKKIDDTNILALKEALKLDENNPEIWAALSDAYTWVNSKGNLNDALIASEKAEDLDSTVWGYANRTAEVMMMLKRYDDAILKFQQVIRMEGNYGHAHISLGIAYKRTGINDLAKTEIQKGIDILIQYNQNGEFDQEILNARKEMSTL